MHIDIEKYFINTNLIPTNIQRIIFNMFYFKNLFSIVIAVVF
jgi:hypothetical protein